MLAHQSPRWADGYVPAFGALARRGQNTMRANSVCNLVDFGSNIGSLYKAYLKSWHP